MAKLTFMKYFFKSPSGNSTVMQPVCVQADEPYDSAERIIEPGGNTGQMSTFEPTYLVVSENTWHNSGIHGEVTLYIIQALLVRNIGRISRGG